MNETEKTTLRRYRFKTAPLPKDRIFPRIAVLALLFLFGLTIHLIHPERISWLRCTFRDMTGKSCPTCGLTRSLHAATHGHVSEAVLFHPFGPLILFGLLALFVKCTVEIVTLKQISIEIPPRVFKSSLLVLFGLWIVFWLTRICINA